MMRSKPSPPWRWAACLALAAPALATSTLAAAQDNADADAEDAALPASEVRVTKLFDARLADAERLRFEPTDPPLDTALAPQTYEVVNVASAVEYAPPSLKPLAVKTEEPPRPYPGFLRLGAGLPLAWLGDLSYARRADALALRGDAHAYGFDAGEQVGLEAAPKYSEVDALVGATYYRDGGPAFDVDLRYDRRNYVYYGAARALGDSSLRLPDDQATQHFGVFGIHLGTRNHTPTVSGIDYYARVDASFLSDNFDASERTILFEAGGRRAFGERWYGEVDLDVDVTRFEAAIDQSLNVYALSPTVGANYGVFDVRVGATVASVDDEFAVFPQVEVGYNLGNGYVAVLGADGGIRKNTYDAMTRYLPYLQRDVDLGVAREWRGYLSFEGQAYTVTYQAGASYSRIEGLALFNPLRGPANEYQFGVDYAPADVLGLTLNASMPLANRLSGKLELDYRNFSLDSAAAPWLLPSFDAVAGVSYEVIPDRLRGEALLTVQNGLPYLSTGRGGEGTGTELRTDALVDLSLEANYFISERFGAFGQVNNLFDNDREQFPNYPILGINAVVGVTARF